MTDNVDIAVKEKCRFSESWEKGESKEIYLEPKKAAKQAAVYDAKRAAQKERFGDVLRCEDDKAEVLKIVKQITATNRDVTEDKCGKNDREVSATSNLE